VAWESQDAQAVYYTRYYRRRDPDGSWLPLNRGVVASGQFAAYSALALPADAGTFSITLVVPSYAAELRALRDTAAFDAFVGATPIIRNWGDRDYAVPTTEVRVMAGFRNSIRRDLLGAPYARGLVMLGDAFMHTDPAFARGISVATMSAFALADVVREHSDPADREAAWTAFLTHEVCPRHDDVVARDAERNAAWAAAWSGEPPPSLPPYAGDVMWADIARATAVDLHVWHALQRWLHVLDRVDEAMTPEVLDRVRALRDAGALPDLPAGPSPDDLRAAVLAAV
jgi:2-polyprenyl-6-methoxyphenol hydroxylase-like FAD-dependent oxidoreductase